MSRWIPLRSAMKRLDIAPPKGTNWAFMPGAVMVYFPEESGGGIVAVASEMRRRDRRE